MKNTLEKQIKKIIELNKDKPKYILIPKDIWKIMWKYRKPANGFDFIHKTNQK